MIFGETPLDDAEGTILAHSVHANGKAFKKGRRLSKDDIADLRQLGLKTVIAARLEKSDIHEDEAAAMLAAVLTGQGLEAGTSFTGRTNLFASAHGILEIDVERIDKVNAISETLTVATAPPFAHVEKGQLVATIKVIPFAVENRALEQTITIATGSRPALSLSPFTQKSVGLLLTRLPNTKPSVLDKARNVTGQRVADLGGTIIKEIVTSHDSAEITEALTALQQANCDPILVLGATAIVDRRDVIPAALVNAGGKILHFGMPVDPGNLLLLGELNGASVVGLPGCARSPSLNGADWVLTRLFADRSLSASDIRAMGVGGLLKEISSRPQPRLDRKAGARALPHKTAALILAAGQSRRMGAVNKLLSDINGKPMVRHIAEAALASNVSAVFLVTGHEATRIQDAVSDLPVTTVHNAAYGDGLSTSLRAGLDALPGDTEGVLVCLGDMPGLAPELLNQIIEAFDPLEGRSICVPTFQGKRGNPVLWARSFFEEMHHIAGDTGAKHLISQHEENIFEVEIENGAAILHDIDTDAALTAYRAGTQGSGQGDQKND